MCGDHVFIEFGFARLILISRVRLPERASVWIGDGSIIAVAEMISCGFERKELTTDGTEPDRILHTEEGDVRCAWSFLRLLVRKIVGRRVIQDQPIQRP